MVMVGWWWSQVIEIGGCGMVVQWFSGDGGVSHGFGSGWWCL